MSKAVAMARWARHIVVLLLIFSTGCVTVSSPWSFPKSPFHRDKTPARNEKASAPAHEEEEEREPLIADSEEEAEKKAEVLKHDPATRMLIETELRDATPEQRAEWIAYLGTVETSEVAELLKERRMATRRETEQLAASQTMPGEQPEPTNEIVPVAHSISTSAQTPASNEEEASSTEPDSSEDHEEGHPGPLAAATSSAMAWPKKTFRSMTDPNRLWPHPSTDSAEENSPSGRNERGPFGLPQVRSNRSEPLANTQEPATVALAPQRPPMQAASIEPVITPGSALWEDEMIKLISLLEAEASSAASIDALPSRQDTRKQIALRMLYLVANEPQKALQIIPGLPPDEQEFWMTLFMGLADHLDQTAANDPAERATQTIAQLRTAAYHLQQTANLHIRNALFCEQINGFGNYDLFSSDEFTPGQTVLIYAEIRNFRSVPTEEGYFLTRIRSTIEIYNTGNGQQLVDRSTFEPTEDRSRTLRTDYYHSYRLDLPANLASGPHLVKLILQDELSGKQTTESIKFFVK